MNAEQAARVAEAREALTKLDFDRARRSDRSALVLLALLGLTPDRRWAEANDANQWRIVRIMEWMRENYAKVYAPNSRETIRRRTLHQFVDAGLVLLNPDDPERAVNSEYTCYQIAPAALELLRGYDEPEFDDRVRDYLRLAPSLRERYAKQRHLTQIPVTLVDGRQVTLTPGGQNVLLKQMVEEFCPRWTPGGHTLYIGDAGRDDPVFDADGFAALGVVLDKHGKLPDLAVYMPDRNWLVLMEAVTSHGPVDAKRHAELSRLFAGSTAGLVFVSCFPSRSRMRQYFSEISWESDAWCADSPDHLIHFNGERFLGPYD
jgi:adenine-specific DNA-methyltransferase